MSARARHLVSLALAAAAVCALSLAAAPQERAPFVSLTILTPVEREALPTKLQHVPIVLPRAKEKGVDVRLWQTTYTAAGEIMRGRGPDPWSGTLFCYELTSDAPYSWSHWSMHAPLGMFRLLVGPDERVYLAWAHGPLLEFAQVNEPLDRCMSLADLFRHEGSPRVHTVPVHEIIPGSRGWGVNALYSEINTLAIAQEAKGNYTITIADPQGKDYTLQSHSGEWRLAEEPKQGNVRQEAD